MKPLLAWVAESPSQWALSSFPARKAKKGSDTLKKNIKVQAPETSPKNYILRNVPGPLWSRVKKLAAREGISIREIIMRGLESATKKTDYHEKKRDNHIDYLS
jgi:hypothetical protein